MTTFAGSLHETVLSHSVQVPVQALKTKKIHQYFSKLGDAAGEGGILRFTVLGETRVFLSAPHTIAVALNKSTFLAKPGGVYDSLFMFVRSALAVHSHIPLLQEVLPFPVIETG